MPRLVTVTKSGPKFHEPRSIAQQLEDSVRMLKMRRRCVAIGNMSGQHQVRCTEQCSSEDTEEHNGRLLCWVHRKAADNAERGSALRFVEAVTKC